jgi:hypothetical protein
VLNPIPTGGKQHYMNWGTLKTKKAGNGYLLGIIASKKEDPPSKNGGPFSKP